MAICSTLLLLTGLPPRAPGEPFRTDINPALLYYQAFILEPHLSVDDSDFLLKTNWQGRQLPERFGKLLSGFYQNEFTLLHQAAQQKAACDWGIDLSRGPDSLLPHLAFCKRAAIAERLHAMWDLQQGDEAGARDDILAALTLGRNTARDSVLIGTLVDIAIENIVCASVAENFGRCSPETLRQLADGFDQAPTRGTILAAMKVEQTMHRDWLINRVQAARQAHPNDDPAVMEELQQMFTREGDDSDTNFWQSFTTAAGGTSEGVINMARDTSDWYDRLAGIMALPHGAFEERFDQLSMEAGKSGTFLFLNNLNGWSRARAKEFGIQGQLAMVKAAVAYKLHGEAGLKSVNDPNGTGPFACQRFVFQGVDRGFQLTSPLIFSHAPMSCIFVEKDGPPFSVFGTHVGEAVTP